MQRLAASIVATAVLLGASLATVAATGLIRQVPESDVSQPGPSSQAQGLDPHSVEAYSLIDVWESRPGLAPAGYLLDPAGIAVDEDGTAYIVDTARSQVHLFREGAFVATWGTRGTSRAAMLDPHGIALSSGKLLIADTGNRRVQVYAKDGTYLDTWTGVGQPWDLVSVSAGRILVTDVEGDQIVALDQDGRRLGAMGSPGSMPGEIASPTGITGWPDGRLAFVDSGNNRVQIWDGEGRFLSVITSTGLLPYVDVASMGDANLLVADLRLLYNYDLSTGRAMGSSRSPVPGGFSSVAVKPSATLPLSPTILATLRHDYLTGLRVFDNGRLLQPEDRLELPGPVGEFSGPRRLVVGDDAVYMLDAWPRIQTLRTDGIAVAQVLVEGVSELQPFGSDAFVASGSSVRRMSGGQEVWSWQAISDTVWLSGLALDDPGRRLVALDLIGQDLLDFGVDGTGPVTHSLGTQGFRSYTDLAATADGRLLVVNRTDSAVELRRTDGTLEDQWTVRGVPLRVEPTPGGGAFVLTREGWVWKLAADGSVLAWWDAADTREIGDARRGTPSDIALSADGRVLIADSRFDRILVYRLDPKAAPNPGPSGDGCTFVKDKWAEPPRIILGETVGVTLSVSGECLGEGQGADIVLVIDRSGSMVGRKIEAARNAAISFVAEIDFDVSRVGLVVFNLDATMPVSLTADAATIAAGVAGFDEPASGTDIGEAIQLAAEELAANGRPDVEHIVVVMTDGRPEGDVVDADQAAVEAKARGIRIFSIGFGTDTDPVLMKRLASTPEDYFFAPGSTELSKIYTEIARRITGGIVMKTAVITDVVPANMDYVLDSAVPPVTSYENRTLTWEVQNVRADLELRYRLRPLQLGEWPTNIEARSEYQDGHDVPGGFAFPIPRVTVVGPPKPIYLPVVGGRFCWPRQVHADVVLVIDASSSMTGDKLAAAKEAARRFVDYLSLPLDRSAIVAFNRSAHLMIELTGDREALHSGIDQISIVPGTVIDAGISLAAAELESERHLEGNTKVMVVMTDGRNNSGPDPVLTAARRATARGIRIYTVAYGEDADSELMRSVAGDPKRAFTALTAADLLRIYAEIAYTIPCL